ncbi:hypothetical protein Scep_012800 [Stephania cephalantha]|uniref:Uncharacterized protein n=1 Tax=Stephania cephalantha TaxID=152367 RepID=A0AAP0JG77_9MAGN
MKKSDREKREGERDAGEELAEGQRRWLPVRIRLQTTSPATLQHGGEMSTAKQPRTRAELEFYRLADQPWTAAELVLAGSTGGVAATDGWNSNGDASSGEQRWWWWSRHCRGAARTSSAVAQRRQRVVAPASSDPGVVAAVAAATNQRRLDATQRGGTHQRRRPAAPATDERQRGCDAMNDAVARCRPVGCAISTKSRRRDGWTYESGVGFVADILLSGLRALTKEAPLVMLHACDKINERLMLHASTVRSLAVARDSVRDPVECTDKNSDLVMHRDKDIDMFHLDWDFNVPVWAYGQPGLGGAQPVTEEPSLSRRSPALQSKMGSSRRDGGGGSGADPARTTSRRLSKTAARCRRKAKRPRTQAAEFYSARGSPRTAAELFFQSARRHGGVAAADGWKQRRRERERWWWWSRHRRGAARTSSSESAGANESWRGERRPRRGSGVARGRSDGAATVESARRTGGDATQRGGTHRRRRRHAAGGTDERQRGCDAMNGAVARCRPVYADHREDQVLGQLGALTGGNLRGNPKYGLVGFGSEFGNCKCFLTQCTPHEKKNRRPGLPPL